jgi:type II secretory pathway pseudopilin PulG
MNANCRGFTAVEVVVAAVIIMILTGVILGSLSSVFRATALSDNTMLTSTQNARAISAMREDLIQTSRNFSRPYAPQVVSGELRFRKISGFNQGTKTPSYENRYTCFYLDTSKDVLYRRYRNLAGDLLSDPKPEAVGNFVTEFTPAIDTDLQTVTITLTTSKGKAAHEEDAAVTRTVAIKPFNTD